MNAMISTPSHLIYVIPLSYHAIYKGENWFFKRLEPAKNKEELLFFINFGYQLQLYNRLSIPSHFLPYLFYFQVSYKIRLFIF